MGREKGLPSLLSWGLLAWIFFVVVVLSVDDNLRASPFRGFITGDFIA